MKSSAEIKIHNIKFHARYPSAEKRKAFYAARRKYYETYRIRLHQLMMIRHSYMEGGT